MAQYILYLSSNVQLVRHYSKSQDAVFVYDYDDSGNMTAFDGQSYRWSGRQLTGYTAKNGTTSSYKYDADGFRTAKTSGVKTTRYFSNGGQILMQKTTMVDTTETLWFFYDGSGKRVGLCYNDKYYYYLYNLQGDVIALADAATGKLAAAYRYDA